MGLAPWRWRRWLPIRLMVRRRRRSSAAAAGPLAERPAHFRPKATRVIFLFMDGGPSQVDTFDPKPRLTREHGQPIKVPVAADAIRQRRHGARFALEIPAVWAKRDPGQRPFSARGSLRRQPGDHSLDDVEFLRAHERQLLHAHRAGPARAAQHGGLGHLWPGEPVPESARLCRAQ